MTDVWIIFVEVSGNSKTLTVPENCHVSHLIKEISTKYLRDIDVEDIRILFADKEIRYDASKRLSDYNIVNHTKVGIVMRMTGGMAGLRGIRDRERTLKALPGFITVTTDPKEPDMISRDNSTDSRRAKMPCGHVIGPESMTAYCNSLLSAGQFAFDCPHVDDGSCSNSNHCNQRWEYFLVRHVACLSADDQTAFEAKIITNYGNKASGVQTCPGCQNLCRRKNSANNRVVCALCTKIKGRLYEFCWACMREWNGSGTKDCRNSGCDGIDGRLRVLESCPTKAMSYSNQECPSVRGCPKCGMLIEHKDKNKHMDCTACKHSFCFVCLQGKGVDGNWKCGSYSGCCTVAARQTSLPGSE